MIFYEQDNLQIFLS